MEIWALEVGEISKKSENPPKFSQNSSGKAWFCVQTVKKKSVQHLRHSSFGSLAFIFGIQVLITILYSPKWPFWKKIINHDFSASENYVRPLKNAYFVQIGPFVRDVVCPRPQKPIKNKNFQKWKFRAVKNCYKCLYTEKKRRTRKTAMP